MKWSWLIGFAAVASLGATGNASLIDAVKNGNRAGVRELVKQRADVNGREVDGTTALHWAVRSDDRETVQLLLQAGASVHAANRYGVTALSLAAGNGNAAIIGALLKAGADASAALPEGETVLMTAARTGDPDSVAALLNAGADVNAREHWLGETALMWAAAENHPDVVSLLIDRGAALDLRSSAQEFAPFKFNLATMVNTVLPRGSLTALMLAARQGALDAARVLVARGADLDSTDPDQTTALVLAIINGHYDVAALLAEKGADPNLGDSSGMAALYAAVDMHTQPPMINRPTRKPSGGVDNLDLLAALLSHGADPNARLKTPLLARYHNTGDGQLGAGATPLMRAAKSIDVPAMRLLLERGADPALKNRTGATALMFAAGAARGKPDQAVADAVALCLDHGADVNAVNDGGQTAVHIAVGQSDAVIRLLAGRGARLDLKDRQGRTPLDLALADAPAGRGAAARGPAPEVRQATAALLTELAGPSSN
ncbi:MAG: ankyrin repeat domain-containing protein [Acidobacteriota bacterium]